MTLLVLLAAFISFVALILGFRVLRGDPGSSINRLFCLMSLSLAVWSLSSLYSFLSDSVELMKLTFRLSSISAAFYAALLLHFVLKLAGPAKSRVRIYELLVYMPPTGLSLWVIVTTSYFTDFERIGNYWSYAHKYGSPVFICFIGYWIFYQLASLYVILRKRKETETEEVRRQSGILALALFSVFLLTLLKAIVLPLLIDFPSRGGALSFQLIFLFAVAYLIDQYRFLLSNNCAEHEALHEVSGYSMFTVNRDGRILLINGEAEKLIGISRYATVGKKIREFISPYTELHREMEKMTLEALDSISCTLHVESKSHGEVPVDVKVTRLFDSWYRHIGYLLLMREKQNNKKLVIRFSLSPREIEVLRLLVNGATNVDIAEALFISERTVKTHVTHIFQKLGVTNRMQAVSLLREYGLTSEHTTERDLVFFQ